MMFINNPEAAMAISDGQRKVFGQSTATFPNLTQALDEPPADQAKAPRLGQMAFASSRRYAPTEA